MRSRTFDVFFWSVVIGQCVLIGAVVFFVIKGGSYIREHGLKSIAERIWEGNSNDGSMK